MDGRTDGQTDGRTYGRTDGQYAILRLARFTEPLPDNKTRFLELSPGSIFLNEVQCRSLIGNDWRWSAFNFLLIGIDLYWATFWINLRNLIFIDQHWSAVGICGDWPIMSWNKWINNAFTALLGRSCQTTQNVMLVQILHDLSSATVKNHSTRKKRPSWGKIFFKKASARKKKFASNIFSAPPDH